MVSSSFTPLRNYKKPLAQMDLKDFGSEMVVWDFMARTPLQVGKAGALAPPRGPLEPEAREQLRVHQLRARQLDLAVPGPMSDGAYEFKKVAETGAHAGRPAPKPRRPLPVRELASATT